MRFNPCARRRKQNAVRRTLFSVEVDLDGGVSARVEDLTRRWGLVSTREVALSALPYLTSVDTGDRHGSSQSAELKGSGVRDRLYLIEKKKEIGLICICIFPRSGVISDSGKSGDYEVMV